MKIKYKYKNKIILILSFIVLSMVGCSKKEKGKAVLIKENKPIEAFSQKEENNKNALDIIAGKCAIIYDANTLYPMIATFEKDSYMESAEYTSMGWHEVLDVKVDGNIVTYSVEQNDYGEAVYYDIKIEVLDENYIRYIYDDEKSKPYELISKVQAEIVKKEYDNKVENGLTIEDKNSEYIIYDSDIRKLTELELSQYTKQELAYIRNEIFARYGYVFANKEYEEYFNWKSWYIPDYSFDGSIENLNSIEKYNVNLIKKLEGK